jgi:5-bromo-4-chloroindolyl phosphate hydrolysis protein
LISLCFEIVNRFKKLFNWECKLIITIIIIIIAQFFLLETEIVTEFISKCSQSVAKLVAMSKESNANQSQNWLL